MKRFEQLLLVFAVAALIVMVEIDRVTAQFVSPAGQGFSATEVQGPLALTQLTAWQGWHTALLGAPIGLLGAHLILGALFAATSGWLAWRWLAAFARQRRWLLLLLGLEAVETVLLTAALIRLGTLGDDQRFDSTFATLVAVGATAGWAAAAALVVSLLRDGGARRGIRMLLARLRGALYAQRLSLIVVGALAAIALIPLPEVLEQLPDIERSWFDDPASFGGAICALIVTLAVALSFFFVGRKRSELYWQALVEGRAPGGPRRYDGAGDQNRWTGPGYLLWFAVPGIVAIAALYVLIAGRPELIDPTMWVFLGLSVGVPGISLVMDLLARRAARRSPGRPIVEKDADPADPDRPAALDIVRAGDVLAALVVVVAGLSLIRSFTSIALVSADVNSSIAIVVGVILAAGALPLLWFVADRTVDRGRVAPASGKRAGRVRTKVADELDPAVHEQRPTRTSVLIVTIIALVAFLFLVIAVLFPAQLGQYIGTAAIAVGLLGAWASLVGVVVIRLRQRRPLLIFEKFGLRSDPVIAVVLIVPIIVGAFSGAPGLHAVALTRTAHPVERPSLTVAYGNWLSRSAGCSSGTVERVDSDGTTVEVPVRPLVLVAAEGGGIRAATWTVDVLSQLATTPCGANAVFLSSGVSGGSVGLATLHVTAQDGTDAGKAVQRLGGTAALSSALTGLLASDPLASTTGVRLPTGAPATGPWLDRAGLIESAWKGVIPGMATAYDATPTSPTGLLVLNSNDIGTGCRVISSQVELKGSISSIDPGDDLTLIPNCTDTGRLPMTIDLVQEMTKNCRLGMDWATAALLSARFPFVTPAGRISRENTPCSTLTDLQVVDGGYNEDSGLSTVSDLVAPLSRIIAASNAKVGTGATDDPGVYVVPVLLDVQNSTDPAVASAPPAVRPELLVPLAGKQAAGLYIAPSSWIQRITSQWTSSCPAADLPCVQAMQSVGSLMNEPSRVIIAAPITRPALDVPLGWTLSNYSRDRLSEDVAQQSEACPAGDPRPCLAQLLALFR